MQKSSIIQHLILRNTTMTNERLIIRREITDEIEERDKPSKDEIIQAVADMGHDVSDVAAEFNEMERHGFLYVAADGVKSP